MRSLLRLALLLLPVLVFSACDSGSDDDAPRVGVTGRWVGELTNERDMSQVFPVELNIVDNRNDIVGTGVVQLPTEALSFEVTDGLFATPKLRLGLLFDRAPFVGSLSGRVNTEITEITGTFSGSGLANGPVTMTLSRSN
ncbi:MAG: hypothetical protein AAFN13_06930 [Bacteroidota bacterium]